MAEPTDQKDQEEAAGSATASQPAADAEDGLRPRRPDAAERIASKADALDGGDIVLEEEEMPAALQGEDKSFSFQLLQFFLFPLLIVISALGVMVAFGVTGTTQSSVEDLLTDLRYGSKASRQKAAYHLAQRFQREPQLALEPEVAEELLTILEVATELTPEMRMYVLLAGAWTKDSRFTPLILEEMETFFALPEGDRDLIPERGDAYSQALQRLADPAAIDQLVELYETQDEYGRLLAIHAMGTIDDPRAEELLIRALDDEYSYVAWNAALRLAADLRRNEAAIPTLRKLLDPAYVRQAPEITEEKVMEWLAYAALAAKTLGSPELMPELTTLSEDTQVIAIVRAHARSAIEEIENPDPS